MQFSDNFCNVLAASYFKAQDITEWEREEDKKYWDVLQSYARLIWPGSYTHGVYDALHDFLTEMASLRSSAVGTDLERELSRLHAIIKPEPLPEFEDIDPLGDTIENYLHELAQQYYDYLHTIAAKYRSVSPAARAAHMLAVALQRELMMSPHDRAVEKTVYHGTPEYEDAVKKQREWLNNED